MNLIRGVRSACCAAWRRLLVASMARDGKTGLCLCLRVSGFPGRSLRSRETAVLGTGKGEENRLEPAGSIACSVEDS